ncbi:putative F-box protein [Acorus calamus]|uniref:F-box protein n=1 Tax=Acorus calamus TaxID=4465 RepID=A0AAV9EC04_ACOCL|nr:putative F-box protein [Acorus calamus]
MAQSVPYEIQTDILSRLPGKSLVRFRGACKRWRDTINQDLRPAPFAVASVSQTRVRVYAFRDAKNAFSLTGEFAWDDVGGETNTVLPSCGAGLVCCHGRRDVLVLNPSTAERLALPRSHHRAIMGCGFGYSRSLDQYKVVRFVDCEPSIRCEVFTIGADDDWRPVEAFDHRIVFNHHRPVCVDGRIHWIGINMHSRLLIIVRFDLETERFTAVDGPRWLSRLEVNGDNLDLRVLEARLCMVKRMPRGRGLKKAEGRQRVEVWVMRLKASTF